MAIVTDTVPNAQENQQKPLENPLGFEPLRGIEAAIAFWNGVIMPSYGDFDYEKPKHFWLVGTDLNEKKSFYQIGIQDDPHGWFTKNQDEKKPESRVREGNCLSLEEIIKRCDGQMGLTFIPSCPPNLPLKSRFNGSKIVWYECDLDSIDKQWDNVKLLIEYGLTPIAIVHSGGKSLHIYFLLDHSVNADYLRYLNLLFAELFNGDRKIATNTVNQMRFPGVDRVKIKDGVKTVTHQTLEYLNPDSIYSPYEIEGKFQKLYEDLGVNFESFEDYQKRLQAEETRYEGIKFDLKDFEGDDIKSEIKYLSETYNDRVPFYSKGANTYGDRFPVADALGALGFSKEECLGLFPNVFRGLENNSMWNSLGGYYNKNPLFTIRKRLRLLIGDNQVNFSDKFNGKYSHKWESNQDDFDRDEWLTKVGEVQQKLTTLSHPPDILVNQKYFPSLDELNQIKPIPNKGILGLVGARGAGKSKLIKQIISYYRALGYNIISLTPTIALGRAQATEWEIEWLGDLEADGFEKNFLARNTRELGLCYNSLKRLKERDYSQKHLIIIDEAEQGLSVPVASSLLKENRPEILKILGDLIRETFDNGGVVLLSDADLSDSSVNYVGSLASEKPPVFIIKNEAKPKQLDVTLYTGGLTDHDAVSDLFTALEDGLNCRFCTDSKNRAKAIEKEFLKRFPDEVCITIHGDNSQEAEIQEFVRDINKSILEHKPRLLIHNQSMGSGVSIDVPHFSRTFGSFCNEDPDQILQSVARDRGQENVTLWVKDSGYSDESLKSYFPNVIKKNIRKDKEQTADIIELVKILATSPEDGGITPQALVNAIQSMTNPQTGQWDNPHINHYCNYKAKRNHAISQMGILLREKLIEEGHNVKEYANGQANSVSDAISENLTEIKWEEATAIANAEDIPIEVAKALNKKQTLSKKDREKISKAFLKLELPELELTPNFIFDWVLKDRRKSLNAVTLFFFAQNPEIAKELDRREFKHHLKGMIEHGIIHAPDIKTFSTRVKLIHDLKFFERFDPFNFDREYRATDEDVQEFHKQACFMKYRLKSAFGLNITKKTDPMGFISDLGKKLGIAFIHRQYREGDKRVRAYRLDPAVLKNPERLEILKILGKKYAETLTGIDFPVSQENSSVVNILQEFPVTESMAKIPPILDSTEPPRETVSPPVNDQNEGMGYDWNEVMAGINSEMGRLGWGVEDGQAHLKRVYGVRSRHLLKDEQVIEFWEYLKAQCLTAIA